MQTKIKEKKQNVEIYQIFSHRNSMLISLPVALFYTSI